MSCRTVRAELVAAWYGDLAPEARRAVEAHLAGCPECAAERDILAKMLAAITPETVFSREREIDWDVPVTCLGVRAELSTFLSDELESGRRDDVLAHLARCRACADESVVISETLSAARGAFADEERVDWDTFAWQTARLAREADARSARSGEVVPLPARREPSWMRVAAPLAASVAVAAILGYLAWQTPTTPGPDTPVADRRAAVEEPRPPAPADRGTAPVLVGAEELLARTRVELAKSDAARYLADSRNVLLSFTELPVPCENESIDVSVEREVSARLLRRKQYLDRELQDVAVARARRLADEVEHLLAEIALLENCVPPERVQEIRDLVTQRQLMMRIEMLTDELGLQRSGRA
jgi:anti-sigma factor RsiW